MSNSVSLVVQTRTIQRNVSDIQTQMTRRGNEVTTGKKQELVKELGGEIRNYLDLNSIRSSLINRQHRLVTGDNRLAQMSVGLKQIENSTRPFQELQAQIGLADRSSIDVYVNQAAITLDEIQNSLNLQWGGRYLFSGDAVLQRPMENMQDLTTAIEGVINNYVATLPNGLIENQTDLDAIFTEIDSIFDDTHPTTTFSALVYRGSTSDMAGIEIAEGEIMQYGVRADSSDLRRSIQGVAMVAATKVIRNVVQESQTFKTANVENQYLKKATGFITAGSTDLIQVQAAVGFKQERISNTQDGLNQIIFQYEERIGLYENADQYEVSVAYSELQRQLEASFYVTANLSEQSLLNYIR